MRLLLWISALICLVVSAWYFREVFKYVTRTDMPPGYQLVTNGTKFDWRDPNGRRGIWGSGHFRCKVISDAWEDYYKKKEVWTPVNLPKDSEK